ncbi:MAG: lytic transglycosylase domain-containing protein [Rhodospirillaceae bacterium]
MRRELILSAAVFAVAAVFGAPEAVLAKSADAAAQPAGATQPQEIKTLKACFDAVEKRQWKLAASLEGRLKDPLARKLAQWARLSTPGVSAELDELLRFIHLNPQWPRLGTVNAKAEAQLSAKGTDAQVLDWFRGKEPQTTLGRVRLGEALLRATDVKDRKRGETLIRTAWIEGWFSKPEEKRFMSQHGRLFGPEDHIKRLDRLLWEGQYYSVRRHLWRVPKPCQALVLARISLRHDIGNVDLLVSRVPEDLQRDPGLIYERLRWRRRHDKDSALDIARHILGNQPYPEKWWNERVTLVRRALKKGFITDAYRIARYHGLDDGTDYAEAEWLAGWVALRFLKEPKVGLQHFGRMFAKVNYPVSRARGAYWIARAHETLGNQAEAKQWHRLAAVYPTTYYGQLSFARLQPKSGLKLPDPTAVSPDIRKQFEAHEMTRSVRLLAQADAHGHLRPVLYELFRRADDQPEWRVLVADLAVQADRRDLGVVIAKLAAREGQILAGPGYPAINLPRLPDKWNLPKIEQPLVLGMIRQESVFDTRAVSSASAQGLMQLMPATAAQVAKQHGLGYSKARLTRDPAYNMTLGQSYLAALLERFGGSYVLAVAAYNAGPHRVQSWIKLNGDPREKDVDMIDWIELIPFDETRNYVQRVMENLHVYRARLADTEVAFAVHEDLHR